MGIVKRIMLSESMTHPKIRYVSNITSKIVMGENPEVPIQSANAFGICVIARKELKSCAPSKMRKIIADALSTGVLAAGGTLGILIPPSVILVIYAILTEQNIVKMFLAAFIPGILAALGYMLAVSVYVRLYPKSATTSPRVPYSQPVSYTHLRAHET